MATNFITPSKLRLACRIICIMMLIWVTISHEPVIARVSKKFLKGFLLGAYMAKHHEPIVLHMEKSHHG